MMKQPLFSYTIMCTPIQLDCGIINCLMLDSMFYVTLNTNLKILHNRYLINCLHNPKGPVFWVHQCHHPLVLSSPDRSENCNLRFKIELGSSDTSSSSTSSSSTSSNRSRSSRKWHFSDLEVSEFTFPYKLYYCDCSKVSYIYTISNISITLSMSWCI